jgi:hypothetical protein
MKKLLIGVLVSAVVGFIAFGCCIVGFGVIAVDYENGQPASGPIVLTLFACSGLAFLAVGCALVLLIIVLIRQLSARTSA